MVPPGVLREDVRHIGAVVDQDVKHAVWQLLTLETQGQRKATPLV